MIKQRLYAELTNSTKIRWNFVEVQELPKVPKEGVELYRSVYLYDDYANIFLLENGSLRKYNGVLYPDQIPIDIDSGSIEEVRSLMEFLLAFGITADEYKVYFSGRGFHIMLPHQLFGVQPSIHIASDIKRTVEHYFNKFDIDLSIYDSTRIFRYPNSMNMKTNLYKIRLMEHQIMNMSYDSIKQLAKKQRPDDPISIGTEVKLPIIEKKAIVEAPKKNDGNPTKYHCIHSMLASEPIEGARHAYLLRLSSHFRRNGYNSEVTYGILKNWLGNHYENGVSERELRDVVDGQYEIGYTYSCEDHILKEHCDSKCIFAKKTKIITADQMAKELREFVNGTHKTIDLRWLGINYESYPGSVVVIVADSGVGKSLFTQNWTIHAKVPTLYINLEMSVQQMYRRYIQMLKNVSKPEAIRLINEDEHVGVDELSHIYMTTGKMSVYDIEKVMDSMSPKPHVVVIDHLLLMDSKKNAEYEKIGELTSELKAIALRNDIIVISLSQISKSSVYQKELTMHSSKGNSSIYQDADTVLLLSKEAQDKMRLKTGKEREGQFFDVVLRYNTKSMRVEML